MDVPASDKNDAILRATVIVNTPTSKDKQSGPEHNGNGNCGQIELITSEPSYPELFKEVSAVVKNSTWFDLYGKDNLLIWGSVVVLYPVGFWCMSFSTPWVFAAGILAIGLVHSLLTVKGAHAASHRQLSRSPILNRLMQHFFIEFVGGFSVDAGLNSHITIHHPHTNIIGLGDSSSWKIPSLSRTPYMFVAPLLLPVVTPLAAVRALWGRWAALLRCILVVVPGYAVHMLILTECCGLAWTRALASMFVSRALLSIPFIHVNIFQHIGLSMYDRNARPRKLRQMSTGCLNLPSNPILDYCFGHTLISCHLEHHLFERLSDNMVLKVKPLVRKFVKSNDLPYHEDTYMNRLKIFMQRYEELMVDAPPITKFIGIQ